MLGKQLSSTLLRDIITRSSETEADRRLFLRSAGLAGVGAVGLGMAGTGVASAAIPDEDVTEDQRLSDFTVLNFALNLEYLEAEFYLYAAYGHGLSNRDTDAGSKGGDGGPKGGVTVKDFPRVKFQERYVRQYAEEIAQDEIGHVKFLRKALGDFAVARPQIDLVGAFDAAAKAAGVAGPDGTFDPFSGDLPFLLGAFIFEDVGVTAYKGGAALINSDTYLDAASSILAVEAYHAGLVRSTLYGIGDGAIDAANKISDARDSLNPGVDNDQGITLNGEANIVPTDENAIVFGRTTQQVHNIAYLTPEEGITQGGFFPNGTNNTNKALTTT